MRRVRVHGMVVESPYDLAGAPADPADPVDVRVVPAGPADRPPSVLPDADLLVEVDDVGTGQRYQLSSTPDGWVMVFTGTAVAAIDATVSHVCVTAGAAVATEVVSTLVNGPLATALALLRGGVVIHASAVAVESRVVALAGPAGSGKSTVAALLAGAGVSLFSDDALTVRCRPGIVTAVRGTLRSRLRTDLVARSTGRATTVTSADGRLLVEHAAPDGADEVALAAVLLPRLSSGFGRVALREVSGSIALTSLGSALAGLRSPRLVAAHFHTTAELVGRVPVLALEVPWDGTAPGAPLRAALCDAVGSVLLAGSEPAGA